MDGYDYDASCNHGIIVSTQLTLQSYFKQLQSIDWDGRSRKQTDKHIQVELRAKFVRAAEWVVMRAPLESHVASVGGYLSKAEVCVVYNTIDFWHLCVCVIFFFY